MYLEAFLTVLAPCYEHANRSLRLARERAVDNSPKKPASRPRISNAKDGNRLLKR